MCAGCSRSRSSATTPTTGPNHHSFDYCVANETTFTRAHVEQKNWTHLRELDRVFTSYLLPQQKLVFTQRNGAKATTRYDTATTPHQRAIARENMRKMAIIRMNAESQRVHPAAQSRHILALTGHLETLAAAKKPATVKPVLNRTFTR